MLTDEQQDHFRTQGYLLLRRFAPLEQVAPVRERIVRELERIGVSSKGGLPKPWSGLSPFQCIGKLSSLLRVPDLEARVVSERLTQAVRALAQPSTRSARASTFTTQCQLLISPPNQGKWTLEGLSWHTDVSATHDFTQQAKGGTPVQAFVLLDKVEQHGGATLILSGSQRVRAAEQGRIRAALRCGNERLAELQASGLRLVELSGEAGDVYLMDMRVLHTPSINASKRFRMVATARFFGP